MKLVCPDCKQEVRTFVGHACMDKPAKTSGGAIATQRPDPKQPSCRAPKGTVGAVAAQSVALPDTKPKSKRGRPKAGEQRDKPWEALGLSERTYYRRLKEDGSVATRKPASLKE